ncbi:MAG: CHASE3 domain-containing protein [Sphingobacteriales bacterium]
MKASIRQKLSIFSLIVLAGNGVLGYAVYQSNQKLHDSELLVQHTEQVIYRSGNVLSIAKDIDAASGGFVITNDSSFLEPLYPAKKMASSNIGQLRQLTLDNPAHQERIDSLELYMHKLLDFSFKIIEIRVRQGLAPAMALVSAKQSKLYTDHIRNITNAIQQEENALLKIRKQTDVSSSRSLKSISRVVFVSMVSFTILLLILIGQYLRQNEEKEKRTAELATANEERSKMVNELMLRNIDLEQFAYIISHNLRTPVANIIGASSALDDPDLSTDDKERLIKGVSVSVMRLDDVVKDLNRILQVKGDVNETKEKVIFSKLVDNIKLSIQHLINKYDVEIKYDFSEINEFFTLKPYLYSIFYNLISNSVKYRRPDMPCIIEIRSSLVNKKLQIIFDDNGMGIDLKKNSGDIFGLYKRFHANIEGKGMGLFMVKTQVETLGGKISIDSIENIGTEFKIEFEL